MASVEKETRRLAILSVAAGICVVTLLPAHPGLTARLREGHALFTLSVAPFFSGIGLVTLKDVIQNVLLFLPLGYLVAADPGGGWAPMRRPGAALAAGLALSLSVEVLQIGIPGRFPSLLDLVFNGLGSLLGGCMAGWFGPDQWADATEP